MKMYCNDEHTKYLEQHIFPTYECDFLKASVEEVELLENLTTKKGRTAELQIYTKNIVSKPEMS